MSIFQDVIKAGCEIDNHESDLYVKVTEESSAIVASYSHTCCSIFQSNIDGQLWYDIAFQYEPYWEDKALDV